MYFYIHGEWYSICPQDIWNTIPELEAKISNFGSSKVFFFFFSYPLIFIPSFCEGLQKKKYSLDLIP